MQLSAFYFFSLVLQKEAPVLHSWPTTLKQQSSGLWQRIKRTELMILLAIALVIGGGLGNLIDRIVHDGRVVDFMQVGFPWLRTGVFNVADMAIMAGVGLMLFATLQHKPPEKN